RASVLYDTIVQILSVAEFAQNVPTPAAQPAIAQKIEQVAAQQVQPQSVGMVDVLIAEDNEINQIVMRQTMELLPYCYEIVSNGKQAVEFWRQQQPRLILMDVSMPEMNGKEATAAIREIEKAQGGHTPIIALTAHALKGDMEDCLNAGMDDYMSKPINHEKLTVMLKKHLGADETLARNAA
ncbi:MAG: response regulator, partial [Rhizobiaceae bacterium]